MRGEHVRAHGFVGYLIDCVREHRDVHELTVAADTARMLKKLMDSADTGSLETMAPAKEERSRTKSGATEGSFIEMPACDTLVEQATGPPLTCLVDTTDAGYPCTEKTFKAKSSLKNHFMRFHKKNAPPWPKDQSLPVGYEHMKQSRVGKLVICRSVSMRVPSGRS